jgi:exosortase A-associated hydrolase 2
MEEAFFFENEGIKLFAVLHRPKNNKEKKGIIFCHPYEEEKQYSYRVFVKFARELCDKNFFVLRFDCRGYGDSQGNFEDATLETQVADTLRAIDLLKVQFGINKVDLLGLRLGGTIAARVAERNDSIEKLILWFPIINGKEYLDELIRIKIFSDLTNKMTSLSQRRIIDELKSKGVIDIRGHYLTKEMYEQLLRIDQTTQESNFQGAVLIVTSKGKPKQYIPFEIFSEVYNKRKLGLCSLKVVEEKGFWNMQSLYDWYFPEILYIETLKWIIAN